MPGKDHSGDTGGIICPNVPGADAEGSVDIRDEDSDDPDILYDWMGPNDDTKEKAQIEALEAKIKDTVGKLSNTGKVWLKHTLRRHLTTPKIELEKKKTKEMTKHVRSGHRTKLVWNTEPCDGCMVGAPRPKYATRNKGPYVSKENTINPDTVFYPSGEDNNGDTCAWHGIELETRVGSFIPASNKSSMQTTNAYLKTKAWIEATADPGGKNGYKIGRHKSDPGSEMEGAMTHAMAIRQVQNHKGGMDVHTDQSFVERAHQQVQQMQASMFHQDILNQPDDEALAFKV